MAEPLIAIVTGSRDWTDEAPIFRAIEALPTHSLVLHGHARGADQIAWRVARKMAFDPLAMPADWDQHGNSAGRIRNREMVRFAKRMQARHGYRVVCLAFPLPQSRGTLDMIALCEAEGWEVRRG